MDAAKYSARLTELRTRQSDIVRLRSEAQGSIQAAKSQLATVESSMRELGVEPDKAEDEVTALDSQIQTLMAQIEEAQVAVQKEYLLVLQTTRAALGGSK